MKIAVITKDSEIALILDKCLSVRGNEVIIYPDEKDSVTKTDFNDYTLCVYDTDEQCSVFLKKMQHSFATVPIIVLSHDVSPQSIDQALNLGVTDYIVRPFSLNTFIERMDAIKQRD